MPVQRRAIRDDQKDARQAAIVDAAYELVAKGDFDQVSMADVASAAGLAKGTLYLYFPTKEALFLAVTERELAKWLEVVDEALAESQPTAAVVATIVARSLGDRPVLARLLTILHPLLEHNIDRETALRFKTTLLQRLITTGDVLERTLSGLRIGSGPAVLLQIYALAIGMYQVANPAPVIEDLLAAPELAVFRIDFVTQFEHATRAFLTGMLAEAQSKGETQCGIS